MIRSGECRRTRTCRTRRIHSDWQGMKSREKASGFREGTHTHTQGGSRGKVWSAYIYIYVIYIYVIYTLLYIQGGKHAASACKGGPRYISS